MPAVHSGLVLVTGATGFIGAQIARQILDAGFAVRLTARTAAKAEYLSKNFDGKVETVIVKDITAPGAFDAAVVGIDAVVNAASPVDLALKGDPALITGPAVAGIMRLLEALDNFSEAKRVIHISSVCTAGGDPATYDGPLTFTEADWNDRDLDTVNTLGAEATGQEKYDASKMLSERAFWTHLETKRSYDGVAILPSMVLGRPTQVASDVATHPVLNWMKEYLKPGISDEQLSTKLWPIVDVLEVADSCVLALKAPAVAGERFLVVAESLWGNDVALAAARATGNKSISQGNDDPKYQAELAATAIAYDGSKAQRVLGVKYRTKEETLDAMFQWFLETW